MPAQEAPRHRLPIARDHAELLVPRAPDGHDDDAGEELLQVGELAKAAGKTVRAIHLYEELGLLRPHARSKGRYRLFGGDALVRVRWIAKLQDLGLTLAEIQGIVREWEMAPSAPGAMRLMRETYRAKVAETRAQIARLRALESELAASLHYLETCDTCDPARLLPACSVCELHDCEQHAPDLVAGFRAGNGTPSVSHHEVNAPDSGP
jgi:MerR family transcriptional regulator, copper efflux regulator